MYRTELKQASNRAVTRLHEVPHALVVVPEWILVRWEGRSGDHQRAVQERQNDELE